MNTEAILEVKDLKKKYRKFTLDVPQLQIPKGFVTALIGENGAGKTTLIQTLAGVNLRYQGDILPADSLKQGAKSEKANAVEEAVRENVGYAGAKAYFLPNWTIQQVAEVSELLFDNFHRDRYEKWCTELGVTTMNKQIHSLSDGMKMKVILAAVLARDTQLLLMDEPASPLDPLMRDKLCTMIGEYIEEGAGEKSVFFSTHNVADMESITDYAVIMENGCIVEQGFVDELKEKYILVKGEADSVTQAREVLYSIQENSFGYEGICMAENLDKLAGMNVVTETATLSQISVAIMKQYTKVAE